MPTVPGEYCSTYFHGVSLQPAAGFKTDMPVVMIILPGFASLGERGETEAVVSTLHRRMWLGPHWTAVMEVGAGTGDFTHIMVGGHKQDTYQKRIDIQIVGVGPLSVLAVAAPHLDNNTPPILGREALEKMQFCISHKEHQIFSDGTIPGPRLYFGGYTRNIPSGCPYRRKK